MAVKPHVAQLCADERMMFVSTGQVTSGFCNYVIDTQKHRAFVFPDDFDETFMLYTATGCFTRDRRAWLLVRWPLEQTFDVVGSSRETVDCEIVRIDLPSLEMQSIYELDNADTIHQLSASDDDRHLVFVPFNLTPKVPYPDTSIDDDAEGYRRSHEAGLQKTDLVTVDIHNRRHWRTGIPIPCPAHLEFDPADARVLYVSAHNFSGSPRGEAILEGPGAIFRMRILDGETVVEKHYSDQEFFRITQHMPFRFDDRTLVAVTNMPNKLDILDGENMTLWHREELFPASPLDFSKTGNAVCPVFPKSCWSINPSDDGRYIVLESGSCLMVFDVGRRRLLDLSLSRRIPEGFLGVGHTRLKGE